MIRRFTAQRLMKPAARDRRPERNRVFRFIVMVLGAGAIAALLAIMIAGAPALLVLAFPTSPEPQIQASTLFPKPSPNQKVVDVYDPPKYVPAPAPAPNPKPQPAQSARPTQSPEPGDGGDGGGD